MKLTAFNTTGATYSVTLDADHMDSSGRCQLAQRAGLWVPACTILHVASQRSGLTCRR